MLTLPGVFSQRTYPGAGDIDDCWVVATIWAASASGHATGRLPTVPEFRAAAGDPDDGVKDGGSLDEVMRGASHYWPRVERFQKPDYIGWAEFVARIKGGAIASLAVDSSRLPTRLQYGFTGPHQVGVAWDGVRLVVMNPLARQGDPLQPIDEGGLRRAATYLYANGEVRAALFPTATSEGEPMIVGGGLVRTSSHVLDLPAGTTVRQSPNGEELKKLPSKATVEYFGIADGWYAVEISTGIPFPDKVARPVIGYVPRTVGEPRAKPPTVPDCSVQVAAALERARDAVIEKVKEAIP